MGKESSFSILSTDENDKKGMDRTTILLVSVIIIGLLNLLVSMDGTASGPKLLILEKKSGDERALEKGLCESAVSSFRTNECIWGVMDEDTCYELENSDDLVNTPARFKVLMTKMIENKCKVFVRDHKEDMGKILRAFAVDLKKDEVKYPWIYQVHNIQEVFITEKEKKEFNI
jgi:hypothetical protein